MAMSYDLSALKRIDSFESREVRARAALLTLAALLHAWLNADPAMLYWLAGHLCAFTLYVLMVARAPKRVKGRQAAVIFAAGIAALASLALAAVYAFSYPGFGNQFAGLVLFCGIAVNIVSIRVRARQFFYTDTAFVLLAAAGMIAVELARSGLSQTSLAVTLGMVLFCAYFLALVAEMEGFRRKLDSTRTGQLASEHQRTIGQISAGVAHDFNNLLTVILGNLELSRDMRNDADREQLLTEAEAAARRGATLTAQLLAFSRKATLSPAPVPLEALAAEIAPLAERMLGRQHRLRIGEIGDLPALYADSAMLLSVLLNLMLNAKEAMPQGGTVWLDAEACERGGREMICLRINDTGTGIAPPIRDQVFEPFFSTKPPGQGSGLGLPMALGFAEQSGGDIEITSTEGDGTEVALYLPTAPKP